MKKLSEILGWILAVLLLLVVGLILGFRGYYSLQSSGNLSEAGPEAPVTTEAGHAFRDLNKNGQLDPYEDSRLPVETRVENLLGQMTVAEKAGLMFHGMIVMKENGDLAERPGPGNPFSFMIPINSELVAGRLMNHFNLMQPGSPRSTAIWHNNLQKLAERTRLGIPVTISSDPRHGFGYNPAAAMSASAFSQWPEPAGLAATRDTALVRQFGEIARQEYRAIGIRTALHPMADLATEPRWGRVGGAFGEDADLASRMVYAYIKGFQGDTLSAESVATMAKHFPGGGPQADGEDAHFEHGKEQVYPGGQFDYHLIPFEQGALAAHTAQIMPYYSIPVGQTDEETGFPFNKEVIDILRDRYGFEGVICTDWSILTDKGPFGMTILHAPAWGVEHLSPGERLLKALNAGVDQFGGEWIPDILVGLVESGQLPETRLDESARRILKDKFTLGLFDDPYIDPDAAEKIVGRADFREAGRLAQRKAIVLLKNAETGGMPTLPLGDRPSLYIENMDSAAVSNYGDVVSTPDSADYAILRLSTPYQPRSGSLLESFFHQGDLDFKSPEKERLLGVLDTVPTIVDMYMERPAVIPEIAERSVGLLANFGAEDDAVLDVIFGGFNPTGKLPFEMPSSMEAVRNQHEDVPYDSENPLFLFGHGLSYAADSTAVMETETQEL